MTGPRAKNGAYVTELADRLRQNLAAGAQLDDLILALSDACSRRVVDVSPATTPDRAALLATYQYAAQSLKEMAVTIRNTHKQAEQLANKHLRKTEPQKS